MSRVTHQSGHPLSPIGNGTSKMVLPRPRFVTIRHRASKRSLTEQEIADGQESVLATGAQPVQSAGDGPTSFGGTCTGMGTRATTTSVRVRSAAESTRSIWLW